MPIYEYQCKKCQSKFELLQSMNADNKGLACPECSEPEPKKVFSLFASIVGGKTLGCDAAST